MLWFILDLFFICTNVLPTYSYVHVCEVSTQGGQKSVSDHMELELQMIVIHHEGPGNQAQVF